MQIYETSTGKLLCSRQLHLQSITHIELSPDASVLVTASTDRFIKVWITGRLMSEERTNLVPVLQIYGHTLPITGVHYGQFATFLYSCSRDATVKVWDLFTGSEVSAQSMASPINTMIMVPLS